LAVDYPDQRARFQVNYLVMSMRYRYRFLIRCCIDNDSEISLRTVKEVFPSIDWAEREIWDLFGVFIVGSVSLRRILTDYGFIGHPLRRDFPLSGFVAVRWSFPLGKIILEPVMLTQEFRTFDFNNPWVVK